jgi:hypothetical protein
MQNVGRVGFVSLIRVVSSHGISTKRKLIFFSSATSYPCLGQALFDREEAEHAIN